MTAGGGNSAAITGAWRIDCGWDWVELPTRRSRAQGDETGTLPGLAVPVRLGTVSLFISDQNIPDSPFARGDALHLREPCSALCTPREEQESNGDEQNKALEDECHGVAASACPRKDEDAEVLDHETRE